MEKKCKNCSMLRFGFGIDEICECPDKNDCIEELQTRLEKAEKVLRNIQYLPLRLKMSDSQLSAEMQDNARKYFEEGN